MRFKVIETNLHEYSSLHYTWFSRWKKQKQKQIVLEVREKTEDFLKGQGKSGILSKSVKSQ